MAATEPAAWAGTRAASSGCWTTVRSETCWARVPGASVRSSWSRGCPASAARCCLPGPWAPSWATVSSWAAGDEPALRIFDYAGTARANPSTSRSIGRRKRTANSGSRRRPPRRTCDGRRHHPGSGPDDRGDGGRGGLGGAGSVRERPHRGRPGYIWIQSCSFPTVRAVRSGGCSPKPARRSGPSNCRRLSRARHSDGRDHASGRMNSGGSSCGCMPWTEGATSRPASAAGLRLIARGRRLAPAFGPEPPASCRRSPAATRPEPPPVRSRTPAVGP